MDYKKTGPAQVIAQNLPKLFVLTAPSNSFQNPIFDHFENLENFWKKWVVKKLDRFR